MLQICDKRACTLGARYPHRAESSVRLQGCDVWRIEIIGFHGFEVGALLCADPRRNYHL
jgi:hypothetical protein